MCKLGNKFPKNERLVGSIAQGVGDSLILAGSVTETITSSTAAIAEETVRVVEDFVGSLSMYFNLHDSLLDKETEIDSIKNNEEAMRPLPTVSDIPSSSLPSSGGDILKGLPTSYVTYRRRDENIMLTTHQSKLPKKIKSKQNDENKSNSIFIEAGDFVQHLFSDIKGVPSFAHDLFWIFTVLYVFTFLLMWRNFKVKYESFDNSNVGNFVNVTKTSFDADKSQKVKKENHDGNENDRKSALSLILGVLSRILLLPFTSFIKIFFSPYILLLSIYIIAFIYLSIKLQFGAEEIKRYVIFI